MRTEKKVSVRDAAVVVLLYVLALLADSVNRSVVAELEEAIPLVDYLMLALITGPLLIRRLQPLTALVVVTGAFLAATRLGVPESTIASISLFVALFSAGAYSRHRFRDLARWAAIVVSMGVLSFHLFFGPEQLPGDVALFQVFALFLNVVFFAAAWLMGDLWRRRAEDQVELARRAEELEAQRDLLARRAVADERLRIARELHDVVGHHVSVMGVQAGAARRIVGEDDARTRELLASIEESGREAVAEMGRLVGFLRDPGDDAAAPQPTLERLDDLVESMIDAGLDVDVHRVGSPRELDSITELSVYRVIQESLTNALRHGAAPRAVVEISYLVGHLAVRVRNPAADGNGEHGRGLVGMRERVGLVGGSMSAGRGTDGMFEVAATFPYGAT